MQSLAALLCPDVSHNVLGKSKCICCHRCSMLPGLELPDCLLYPLCLAEFFRTSLHGWSSLYFTVESYPETKADTVVSSTGERLGPQLIQRLDADSNRTLIYHLSCILSKKYQQMSRYASKTRRAKMAMCHFRQERKERKGWEGGGVRPELCNARRKSNKRNQSNRRSVMN